MSCKKRGCLPAIGFAFPDPERGGEGEAGGGSGLILEGLKGLCIGRGDTFCQGFLGVNPLSSNHGDAQWNFF